VFIILGIFFIERSKAVSRNMAPGHFDSALAPGSQIGGTGHEEEDGSFIE
jgi:hypothetical protein